MVKKKGYQKSYYRQWLCVLRRKRHEIGMPSVSILNAHRNHKNGDKQEAGERDASELS
jgi:hypothetical protein